jgi:GDP-D-mannose dehydratase
MAELNLLWPRAIAGEVFDESEQTTNTRSLERIRHYKAQLDLYESRASLYGPENAVRDMANPFSPVVRYYLAKTLGLHDIMKSFEALAKDEVLASKEARETFDEI